MPNTNRTACAALLFALLSGASPALAGVTPNYMWTTPTVGANENTWGATLNATTVEIDEDLKVVENIARGVNAAANPAQWQVVSKGAIETTSGSLNLNLGACKGYRLLVRGLASTFDGAQMQLRFAFNDIYDSSATYSYSGSYQNTAPAAGTFGSTNQTQISLGGSQTLGDDAGLNSTFDIQIFTASQNPTVIWDGWFVDAAANHARVVGGGRILGISVPTHVGLFLSSGTFRSGGTYALYCAPHL